MAGVSQKGECEIMTLLLNKWCFLLLVFLCTASAAWSKSLTVYGIFTETGQISPDAWRTLFTYSALLVPLDVLLTVFTLYFVGKRLKR